MKTKENTRKKIIENLKFWGGKTLEIILKLLIEIIVSKLL